MGSAFSSRLLSCNDLEERVKERAESASKTGVVRGGERADGPTCMVVDPKYFN